MKRMDLEKTRMNKVTCLLVSFFCFLSVGFGMRSWAGGLYINEFATPSLGTAGAGAQAWADNASTSFFNAAGMTRLNGRQLLIGGGLIFTDIGFDADPDTPVVGGDGGNAGGGAPLLNAFYVHSLSEDLKLGLDLGSVSAAVLEYDGGWAGRRQCQRSELLTMTLHPSLAYRINDWLSVAGGVGLIYGSLKLDVAGLLPDSKISIDGDDFEYNFNLSAMFELSDRTRIGVTYWSKADLNFSGDVTFTPLPIQAGIDTSLPLPQWVKTGVYHEINDRLALLGTIGWEDWSKLASVNISTANVSVPAPKNWKDTWHFAGGIHIRPSNPWLLQFGIAYDTSPVGTPDRTADMPVDRQIRYAAGVQYEKSERWTIGCAFEYADLGDAEIDNPSNINGLKGSYGDNDFFAFTINFNWKFGPQ